MALTFSRRPLAWHVSALAVIVLFMACGCGDRGPAVPDSSTPTGAVASLMRAIDLRDEQMVINCYASTADPAYPRAMARVLAANKALEKATAAKLGRDAAKLLAAAGGPNWQVFLQYEGAVEKIEGDTATLTCPDGAVVHLVREQGQWKILRSDAASGDADMARARAVLERFADAIESVAAQVQAGQLKDIKLLRARLRAGLEEALSEPPPPATRVTF